MRVEVSEDKLVLEEEYLGRRWLIVIGIVLALMGLLPGLFAAVKAQSVIPVAVGGCMAVFVFGAPFFAVLALSSYRRAEIDTRDGSVAGHRVYRLFRPKVVRFAGAEVREIVCERATRTERGGVMSIDVVTRDGTRTALINRAAWSDDVVSKLLGVYGNKVVVR